MGKCVDRDSRTCRYASGGGLIGLMLRYRTRLFRETQFDLLEEGRAGCQGRADVKFGQREVVSYF